MIMVFLRLVVVNKNAVTNFITCFLYDLRLTYKTLCVIVIERKQRDKEENRRSLYGFN